MDPKRILKHYVRRLLIVDILVIFPIFFTFDDEESSQMVEHLSSFYNSKLSLIKLLFIFRLVKLKRTFYYIEQILANSEKIEGLVALLKLCFKILFTAHLIACCWYFLGDYNKRRGISTWIEYVFENCNSCDWRTYYLYSLYWSITTMITVGYGDISPKNSLEVGFTIGSLIIGCGVFGYSLSNIGIIFEKIFSQENDIK